MLDSFNNFEIKFFRLVNGDRKNGESSYGCDAL